MSDSVNLVVSSFDNRQEVNVPLEFIDESTTTPTNMLLSFLRESGIVYPDDGMVTRIESGFILHAVPKFG